MPTPTGVDDVDFREIARHKKRNRGDMDTMVVILRGESTQLLATESSYQLGDPDSEEADMYLQGFDSLDSGPVSDLQLTYVGILSERSPENGVLVKESTTRQKSVMLTNDLDKNVYFNYFAPVKKTVWMHRSKAEPSGPQFQPQNPPSLNASFLTNPNPANHGGSIEGRYTTSNRLALFNPERIAPGIWKVTEAWELAIEPSTPDP